MANLFDSLRDAARGAYCATAGPLATGLSILGNIYEGFGGEENGEDLRASAQLLRNAQQVACNRLPDNVSPLLQPPFTGGQCVGVPYRFDTQSTLNGQVVGSDSGVQANGAINIGREPNPFGGEEVFLTSNGVRLVGSRFPSVSGGPGDSVNIQISNMARVDGQPDDCGDPPIAGPEFDPEGWSVPVPVTYDDDNGSPVTINPTFDFGPNRRGPNGGIRVPISIDLGDGIDFNAEFDLETGDITFGPTGTGGPGDDSVAVEGDDPERIEETTARIIGVRVVASGPGPGNEATELLQSGGTPPLWVPRIGTVSFLYRLSNGVEEWSRDYDVKRPGQVIWVNRSPVRASVTFESGWTGSIRYQFSLLPCSECC